MTIAICFMGSGVFARPAIPKILKVEGRPEVFAGREGPWRPVKVGDVYQEMAKFRLGEKDRLQVQIQGDRVLEFSAGAQFSFPGIRFETGETPQVMFEQGTVRWRQPRAPEQEARLVSPLFDLAPPVGDFIFQMDPQQAQAEVMVLAGGLTFQPLNSEASAEVKAMERVKFVGVIEDREIAYDILLRGRKIPRGELEAVRPFTKDEARPFLEERKVELRAQEVRRKEIERQREEDAKVNRICERPKGRLFECAWTCEGAPKGSTRCPVDRPGVSCVRRRCNANGEWAEATPLKPAEARNFCQKIQQVGPCR